MSDREEETTEVVETIEAVEGDDQSTIPADEPGDTPDPLDFDDPTVDAAGDDEITPDTDDEPKAVADEPQSDELMARARELGMSEADIDAWSDHPELLTKHLDALDTPAATDSAATDEAEADDAKADDETDFEITLDPEQYEPELVAQFKEMNDHIQTKLASQEAVIGRLLDHLESQHERAAVSRFDGYVEALGRDYHKSLGEGTTEQFVKGSVERRARDEIWDSMRVLEAGYQQRGEKVPNEPELFAKAIRVAIGDDFEKITRQKIQRKVAARGKRTTNRPTQRQAPKVTGEQAAVASVAALLQSQGNLDEEYMDAL